MRQFKAGERVDRDKCTMGLDVSTYQKGIDFAAARQAGYRFVYVKATQATKGKDQEFSSFVKSALEADFLCGAYHFAVPDGDPGDAVLEAENFARTMEPAKGLRLPPVLDVETVGFGGAPLQEWLETFERRLEELTGVLTVLYTSPAYYSVVGFKTWPEKLTRRALWVAHWDGAPGKHETWQPHDSEKECKRKHLAACPSMPPGFTGWDFWQIDAAKVPFCPSMVDRNLFNGSIEELSAFCLLSARHDIRKAHEELYGTSIWTPGVSWRDVVDRLFSEMKP